MNPLIISTLKKFRHVYFQASDPGAFYLMEPVFRLAETTGIKCEWIFEGWCGEKVIHERKFLEGKGFMKERRNKLRDCCFVLGTSVNYKRTHQWIDFTLEKNMNSIVFIDYWNNYMKNFYDVDTSLIHLPKKIWIMDEMAENELRLELEKYISNNEFPVIEIVGHPGIENTKREINNFTPDYIHSLKKRYGSNNKKLVMLALEPIKMDKKPEAEEFDEFKVIKYFFRKKATPEMKVLVRPHPRQSLEKIKKLVEKEAENARIEYEFTGNEPINELLAVSDEVAGTTSTVLVIAMKLGIKISSIMPGASRKRVFAAPNILKPYIET